MNIIYSLQILRFFAALSVIIFHVPIVNGTSIGVDVFFIISGFVIALVLRKSNNYFLLRRIIRILPLYWLLTIFIFISKTQFPFLFSFNEITYVDLIKSLFFIPIYSEIENKILYPIIMVGWTLNYEIFFYFIVAIILLFTKKNLNLVIIAVLLSLFFISNLYKDKHYLFLFISNSIILEFAFGIILFLIYNNFKNNQIFDHFISIISVFILLILSFYFFQNFEIRIINHGIPAFLLVFLFLQINKYFKENKFFNTLGVISYAMYLVHPYFLSLNYKIISKYNIQYTFISYFICLTIIIIISYLIYRLFEKNVIKYLKYKLING